MTARLPFNKRQRRRMSTQYGYGHRPRNAWGGGDLPSPYAEGDIVYYDGRPVAGRMRHMEGHAGHYVVCTAFSIDEGDAWYMRVQNDTEDPDAASSDRLHVFYPERSSEDIRKAGAIDYMAGFTLIDTADPEGLAERERLIAAGWKLPAADLNPALAEAWQTCSCGKERHLRGLLAHIPQLCRACSHDIYEHLDQCSETVPVPGGSSACGLPLRHTGRCRPIEDYKPGAPG